MKKIEAIIKYVKSTSEKDAVRLANEIQQDAGLSKSKTQAEAVNFFKEWLPSIDSAWLEQIHGAINRVGTFADPFCNNGGGR